jgi:glycerol-3-phosphate cytidylyltransferase-like family protein
MKNLQCYKDWEAIDASKAAVLVTYDTHNKAKDFVDKLVIMSNSDILRSRGVSEGKKMIFKYKNRIYVFTNYRFIQVIVTDSKNSDIDILHNHSYVMWKDLLQFDVDTATSNGLNSTRNVMLKFKDLSRIINIIFDSSNIGEVHQFLSSIQVNSIVE